MTKKPKIPTLDEINHYYRNAYSVIGLYSTRHRVPNIVGEIYFTGNAYLTKSKPWDTVIWSELRGYAEIHQTKAERFLKISRVIKD